MARARLDRSRRTRCSSCCFLELVLLRAFLFRIGTRCSSCCFLDSFYSEHSYSMSQRLVVACRPVGFPQNLPNGFPNFRSPDPQAQDPKPKIQAKNPKPKISSQSCRVSHPKPRFPSPRSEARDPKPKIQSQGSQTKDPKTS